MIAEGVEKKIKKDRPRATIQVSLLEKLIRSTGRMYLKKQYEAVVQLIRLRKLWRIDIRCELIEYIVIAFEICIKKKVEAYTSDVSVATRAIREPRVVVQIASEVDILDDGHTNNKDDDNTMAVQTLSMLSQLHMTEPSQMQKNMAKFQIPSYGLSSTTMIGVVYLMARF
ncbi:hypothetical protein Tco_0830147 [Tanacetum coccineum]